MKNISILLSVFALMGCSTTDKAIEKEIVALYQQMNGNVNHDREILRQQDRLRIELVDRGYFEKNEYKLLDTKSEPVDRDEVVSQIQEFLKKNQYKAASVETRGHIVNYEEKGFVIIVFDRPNTMKAWDELIGTFQSANQTTQTTHLTRP